MRALPLAALLAGLAGCVVADPYRPVPPPQPPPSAAAPAVLSRDQAVQAAFRVAAERQLEVERVQHAHLDLTGRWHVDLHGVRDRAQVVIDGRDGRFLQGRFRSGADAPPAAPEAPAPPDSPPPPAAPAPPAPPPAEKPPAPPASPPASPAPPAPTEPPASPAPPAP